MSLLSSGGRFASSDCYVLLSCDANVIDLSYGMRDLCRRFRPRDEVPSTFKTLIVERDHTLLLDHLESVWRKQESATQDLHLARSFGTPLSARMFSVPAPREKAVQSFLSIEGSGAEELVPRPSSEVPRMMRDDHAGFMVLRPDGDFSRPLITFCDSQLRASLGAGALADRSIFQVFAPEACRIILDAIRDARMSSSSRRCVFTTRAGVVLRAVVFVSNESVMLLAERKGQRALESTPGGVPQMGPRAAPDLDRFLRLELRPALRALHILSGSLKSSMPEGRKGFRRAEVVEQLTSQIVEAVEALEDHHPADGMPAPEDRDVVGRLVEGVRDVAHPALAGQTRSVAVIDEVPPDCAILSTYSLQSLQQLLVDLLGEAAQVVCQPDLECRISPREERVGRVNLEFTVRARGATRDDPSFPSEEPPTPDRLRRRPMFKACRRFLKALGAELDIEVEEGAVCCYRFELPFGKPSDLQSA